MLKQKERQETRIYSRPESRSHLTYDDYYYDERQHDYQDDHSPISSRQYNDYTYEGRDNFNSFDRQYREPVRGSMPVREKENRTYAQTSKYDNRTYQEGTFRKEGPQNRVSYNSIESNFDVLPIGGTYDNCKMPTLFTVGCDRSAEAQNTTKSVKNTKKRISNKGIALIAVYFVIIVTITTLILLNAFPAGAKNANAENNTQIETPLSKDAALTYSNENGQTTVSGDGKTKYTYEKSTNVFDKICDWIENLLR